MQAQSPEPAQIIETPLAAQHRQAGARMGAWFGCALPDDFGDWQGEYWFAHKSVALIDKNYRAYFSFTGPDRVRYLNAILTNNIKDLAPDQGTASLLLNPQGHILAEIETYRIEGQAGARADSLFCISYAMIRERLVETLEKYIIMDDVTLTDETDGYGTLALEGPQAAQLVQQVAGADITSFDELSLRSVSVGGVRATLTRRSPSLSAGAEFLVEREHLQALWTLLQNETTKIGGGPIGYTALNVLRLEQGIPWFGYDFAEKQIPHEATLETSHISYTKGCYTGQEIVERVRSRGQVNRRRVSLRFSGDAVPSSGETLTAEGKDVGYITRAAYSPAQKTAIGMAYVRRENNSTGNQVRWKGGTAEVVTIKNG